MTPYRPTIVLEMGPIKFKIKTDRVVKMWDLWVVRMRGVKKLQKNETTVGLRK